MRHIAGSTEAECKSADRHKEGSVARKVVDHCTVSESCNRHGGPSLDQSGHRHSIFSDQT